MSTTVKTPAGVTVTVGPRGVTETVHDTIYAAELHVRTPSANFTLDDPVRLTPLPTAGFPKVMFMGVMSGGRAAAFALGTGVTASGPAVCRPSHASCSLIVLPAGRREQVNYFVGALRKRTLQLTVPRITSQVTHSTTAASAAGRRYSAIGACELQLGDPLLERTYNAVGTVSVASVCTRKMKAVAFPAAALGGGL